MMQRKSLVAAIRTDWKAMTLFWSMLICMALIIFAVVVITRLL